MYQLSNEITASTLTALTLTALTLANPAQTAFYTDRPYTGSSYFYAVI